MRVYWKEQARVLMCLGKETGELNGTVAMVRCTIMRANRTGSAASWCIPGLLAAAQALCQNVA